MTTRTVLLAVAAMGLWIAGTVPSHASTVTPTPGGLQTGLIYEWQVVMDDLDGNGFDLAHYHGSVGAKSWAEPGNPASERGWTHTSDWTALDLTGLSGPTLLTLELGRQEDTPSQLFPAFTLFSGWETVNSDSTQHTFDNIGETGHFTNLTYIDHLANAGGPNGTDSGTGLDTLSKSWVLTPGLYTLNYGGNPSFVPPLGQTGSHQFAASLATSPAPVPAAVWLFGSGLAALVGLARRRMNA